ncbi:helix-turn-helix domain-containing protein [Haloplanus rubicundus]
MSKTRNRYPRDEPDPEFGDLEPHPSEWKLPTPEELRELRILSGLTIREVAHRIDVSPDSVRRWEKGQHSPRLTDVRVIVEVCLGEAGE